jgi:hypothetical protein
VIHKLEPEPALSDAQNCSVVWSLVYSTVCGKIPITHNIMSNEHL